MRVIGRLLVCWLFLAASPALAQPAGVSCGIAGAHLAFGELTAGHYDRRAPGAIEVNCQNAAAATIKLRLAVELPAVLQELVAEGAPADRLRYRIGFSEWLAGGGASFNPETLASREITLAPGEAQTVILRIIGELAVSSYFSGAFSDELPLTLTYQEL